ncbi:hypothetical protein RRG08_045710 [Elysia crispata]|uniref:Uncharacterized protein n=1 Tax=Elysia crispata TaxID=231223 RepID=A0AAE0Z248_9GAST|nr:hypothetical protein RRG08_045710 [Elysia crispata]
MGRSIRLEIPSFRLLDLADDPARAAGSVEGRHVYVQAKLADVCRPDLASSRALCVLVSVREILGVN